MRAKISVIGAGNVGKEVALWCALKELGDIVLWNRTAETAIGNALDIMETGPIVGFDAKVIGTGDLNETKKSDIIVLTAGMPRKPGQTREQLVEINSAIVYPLIKKLAKLSPKSIIIIITNPLDAMAYLAYKASKFSRNKIIGMAGVLDSSRFSAFVSKELKVSIKDTESLTLGSHGEEMVPLPRFSTVNSIPLSDLLKKDKIKAIVEHTKKAGEEIIRLLGTNASISTGAAASRLIETILHDEREILPCSVYLDGEYGIHDLFIGVPVILGASGVEKIVELKLNDSELKDLHRAAESIRKITAIAKKAV